MTGHQDEIEPILDFVDTILDGDARHGSSLNPVRNERVGASYTGEPAKASRSEITNAASKAV
jgi:hypothetical protein